MKSAILAAALVVVACSAPSATPTPGATITEIPSSPGPTSSSAGVTPGGSAPSASPAANELVLMTHDAFAASDNVMAAFEQQYGVTVKVLKSGDAGSMVNQAILAKSAPLADVLYGVDNTFLSRALDAGIFEPYTSPGLSTVPAGFYQPDPQHRVTPIDFGDVCLNYNVSAFTTTPPPAKLLDLLDPKYKDMLVVENPATSSPGLSFVLATVESFGNVPGATAVPRPSGFPTWQSFWQQLRANGVLVSDNWEDAYYNQFSGAGGGTGNRPIVVSYATSPAAEVVYAPTPAPSTPPTANVTDGCFRQVEFAGVLANGNPQKKQLAQEWIDFMLSKTFQEDMPLQMYVWPVNGQAQVPDVFTQTNAKVADPIEMDPLTIGRIRDQVIQEWTNVVLH